MNLTDGEKHIISALTQIKDTLMRMEMNLKKIVKNMEVKNGKKPTGTDSTAT